MEIMNYYISATGGYYPVGTILILSKQYGEKNFMLCDGRHLKISAYPDLYKVIGDLHSYDYEYKHKSFWKLRRFLGMKYITETKIKNCRDGYFRIPNLLPLQPLNLSGD